MSHSRALYWGVPGVIGAVGPETRIAWSVSCSLRSTGVKLHRSVGLNVGVVVGDAVVGRRVGPGVGPGVGTGVGFGVGGRVGGTGVGGTGVGGTVREAMPKSEEQDTR